MSRQHIFGTLGERIGSISDTRSTFGPGGARTGSLASDGRFLDTQGAPTGNYVLGDTVYGQWGETIGTIGVSENLGCILALALRPIWVAFLIELALKPVEFLETGVWFGGSYLAYRLSVSNPEQATMLAWGVCAVTALLIGLWVAGFFAPWVVWVRELGPRPSWRSSVRLTLKFWPLTTVACVIALEAARRSDQAGELLGQGWPRFVFFVGSVVEKVAAQYVH